MNTEVVAAEIEGMIYVIRCHRVMLDDDLAALYGVSTKYLNRSVKRNMVRFPDDFMFQLTDDEANALRCQIGTSKIGRGGRRYNPFVFTENGVAMLSSILNSDRAVLVNIAIMRIFTRLRSYLMMEKDMACRVERLEEQTGKMFKIVFERLDDVEVIVSPKILPNKRKIGIKTTGIKVP